MVTAVFKEGRTASVYGLWQWDFGQVLRIQGLKLQTAVEIHFSLQEKGGEAVTRVGTTKDNVTDVVIPDSMLENENTYGDYYIYAFIYLTDGTSGQTEYKISMNVRARPKPEAFDKPEDAEIFRQAIAAVKESADRADAAADAVEQTEADMKEWVSGQKTEITGIKGEAVTAKNTAVENANIAVNHAEETEADKRAVESAKTDVESLKEATDANLAESERILQEQIAMLGTVPMIYAVTTLEELQAYQKAKEGDFGIIQEPRAMLFRYYTKDVSGNDLNPPAWQWMTDMNITFTRESLLNILHLSDIATSGSYTDLTDIPNRYNVPLILDDTGEVVEWNYSQSDTAVVTLTESKPLRITGGYNGAVAVIQVYGSTLEFPDEQYNRSATLSFLEPLEAEHITYTLIYNAGKWDVSALVYAGGEPDA